MIGGFLVGVAGVLAPLGLHEIIVADHNQTVHGFHYIADNGIFGLGTPPRNNSLAWSRKCGFRYPKVCPDSGSSVTWVTNTSFTGSFDTRVPQSKLDLFSSGSPAFGYSVSSVFDIQYRSWVWENDTSDGITFDNGSAIAVGNFQSISTLAMNDGFMAIGGLVVDMAEGGVGFRNQSAAPLTLYGSVWAEDLLFIQPVTQCVDTNISLDYSILRTNSTPHYGSPEDIENVRLTDRGGFAELNLTKPTWDQTDRQKNPELWMRAYEAAWFHNVFLMMFMNITNEGNKSDKSSRPFRYRNSAVGKSFPLQYTDGSLATSGYGILLRGIQVLRFGEIIMGTDMGVKGTTDPTTNISTPGIPPLYPNPFGINDTNFDLIELICGGAGVGDLANITNFAAKCGILLGVPQRSDGTEDLMLFPGSEWTVPIYSCITVTQALLRTVTLLFNTTDDLGGIEIIDIADKTYPTEDDMPLWGVENIDNSTGLTLADVNPIWGLVAPDRAAAAANISMLRKESLFLPGYYFLDITGKGYGNLAGVNFPAAAIGTTYSISAMTGNPPTDYTGKSKLAMSRRWKELSRSDTTASKILNLIWTDLAANAVVGTRGVADPSATGGGVPVTIYSRRLQYNLLYAVPAFVVLSLLVLLALLASVAALRGRASLAIMRRYLNATSAGRIMTAVLHVDGDVGDGGQDAALWAKDSGKALVMVGDAGFEVVDAGEEVELDSLQELQPEAE